MNDNNVLEPADGEDHTKLNSTNPNKTDGGSNDMILDIISALTTARENHKIITSAYLEFTCIDDPEPGDEIIIEYKPENRLKPENE